MEAVLLKIQDITLPGEALCSLTAPHTFTPTHSQMSPSGSPSFVCGILKNPYSVRGHWFCAVTMIKSTLRSACEN